MPDIVMHLCPRIDAMRVSMYVLIAIYIASEVTIATIPENS